ncbi:D-alanine--(R)-lactate ligase, partial [Clostridium perfringens]|nr:D-alanine--(R)-lactate ligase [Clostridium perfringens]
ETAPSITVFEGARLDQAVQDAEKLGFPLYIKPAKSGSSFGITKAYSKLELMNGIQAAVLHDGKVVIEQNVSGFEVGCAVLGHSEDPIIAEVDEIELTGEFFDYEEKYSLRSSRIHLPATIDAAAADKIKDTARLIYKALG